VVVLEFKVSGSHLQLDISTPLFGLYLLCQWERDGTVKSVASLLVCISFYLTSRHHPSTTMTTNAIATALANNTDSCVPRDGNDTSAFSFGR